MIGVTDEARYRANRKGENDSAEPCRAMAACTFGLGRLVGSPVGS